MNISNIKKEFPIFTNKVQNNDLVYLDSANSAQKPKVLIANTIKGKGFSFSENNNDWHHSVLTKSFYDKAIEELSKNKLDQSSIDELSKKPPKPFPTNTGCSPRAPLE